MNARKKAMLKDKILMSVVTRTHSGSVHEIAQVTKEDVKLIAYLSEELGEDDLVRLTEVTSKSSEIPREYLLSKTNKGICFLSFDGGFFNKYRKEKLNEIWTMIKITAAIINAIAILVLGIYSVYLSDKSDRQERENKELRIELKNK